MKHAFLIIAHNNWWQLKQLIHQLDNPLNDIYVHIDKKSTGFRIEEFTGITKYSKLYFYSYFKVYWGGYSQVQVELLLLKKAHQVGYDYYHIISNADLCLWSNEKIHQFFEENRGKEFLCCDPNAIYTNPEIGRRARLYHFLQNYRRRYKIKIINEFFTFLERCSLFVQILFRINRVKNLKWDIVYGSNWMSITNSLVEEVLRNTNEIERIFRWTNCSDELFIQTIAWNCGFKDKIYQTSSGPANLRFIDWSRGKNGNPYTFHLEDYDQIINSSEMFARKFSESVDKKIIEKIAGNQ